MDTSATSTNFYLLELAANFESESELAIKRIRAAQSVMDLVKAHQAAPVAQTNILKAAHLHFPTN